MRFSVIGLCVMFALISGCTRFSGEWLEEGTVAKDGTLTPADSDRRVAMRFDWPATVRYGSYADRAGVVDDETVQWNRYWTLKNDQVAQTGAMSATVDGDHMTTVVEGDVIKRFVKVKGPSIFPPEVKCPPLSTQ